MGKIPATARRPREAGRQSGTEKQSTIHPTLIIRLNRIKKSPLGMIVPAMGKQ
jgi:hypothetical protein